MAIHGPSRFSFSFSKILNWMIFSSPIPIILPVVLSYVSSGILAGIMKFQLKEDSPPGNPPLFNICRLETESPEVRDPIIVRYYQISCVRFVLLGTPVVFPRLILPGIIGPQRLRTCPSTALLPHFQAQDVKYFLKTFFLFHSKRIFGVAVAPWRLRRLGFLLVFSRVNSSARATHNTTPSSFLLPYHSQTRQATATYCTEHSS